MNPQLLEAYLKAARQGGAQAVEIEDGALKLRFSLSPLGDLVAHRPKPGELEERLGEVDDDLLYASGGR